jgi:elongation factor Tu
LQLQVQLHHTKSSKAQICLEKEKGGRHSPFFTGYDRIFFQNNEVTRYRSSSSWTRNGYAGDDVEVTVELVSKVAMDEV